MKKLLSLIYLSFSVTLALCAQQSLTDKTVSIDSGYVNVNGGKLFYEIAGKGRNIVLLHDGMVNRQIWDDQFPFLAKNYRVVRYDRRGYGKSTDPQTQYSHIDDLYQIFDQLKVDNAVVFGMSSGGGLAIDFTLKYPEKVTGLVLVGAVVSGLGYTSHMTDRGGHFNPQLVNSDPEKVIEYFIKDDPFETYSGNTEAKERLMGLRPYFGRDNRVPTRPAERVAVRYLSEIKARTLILAGEYDIPDVHAHAGAMDAGIPDSRREIIRDSGHLIPLEQPALFNEMVSAFLNRLPGYGIADK